MKEREYYEIIRDRLTELLGSQPDSFHLEITADKRFSNILKEGIGQYREIIFYFLREAAPDITGFIKKQYSTEFIVVEVKRDIVKIEDIYQTRKYAYKTLTIVHFEEDTGQFIEWFPRNPFEESK